MVLLLAMADMIHAKIALLIGSRAPTLCSVFILSQYLHSLSQVTFPNDITIHREGTQFSCMLLVQVLLRYLPFDFPVILLALLCMCEQNQWYFIVHKTLIAKSYIPVPYLLGVSAPTFSSQTNVLNIWIVSHLSE